MVKGEFRSMKMPALGKTVSPTGKRGTVPLARGKPQQKKGGRLFRENVTGQEEGAEEESSRAEGKKKRTVLGTRNGEGAATKNAQGRRLWKRRKTFEGGLKSGRRHHVECETEERDGTAISSSWEKKKKKKKKSSKYSRVEKRSNGLGCGGGEQTKISCEGSLHEGKGRQALRLFRQNLSEDEREEQGAAHGAPLGEKGGEKSLTENLQRLGGCL